MTNNLIDEAIKRVDEMDSLCAVCRSGIKSELPDILQTAITKTRESMVEEIKEEVHKIGDTSDYPEWHGLAGVNVGLIPKERILDYLTTLLSTSKEKE